MHNTVHVTLYLLLVILNIFPLTINATNFNHLPDELQSHSIFSALSVQDKFQSLLLLNRAAYHHVSIYHEHEINLVKQLMKEFASISFDYNTIKNITQQLRFSEWFYQHLPSFLDTINTYTRNEIKLILDAMNMHTMSISEFVDMRHINTFHSDMDIIILSSRALLQYYVPQSVFITNSVISTQQVTFAGSNIVSVSQYPWVLLPLSSNHFFNETSSSKYSIIYMSYLYEFTFDFEHEIVNIPPLDSVYKHKHIMQKPDIEQRQNLQQFMELGLILWSRDNMNRMRSIFFSMHANEYKLYHFVLEAHRINKILLRYRGKTISKHYVQSMATFILDIALKYNISMEVNTTNRIEMNALAAALHVMERLRFKLYSFGDMKLFQNLTELMYVFGAMNDNETQHVLVGLMAYLVKRFIDVNYMNDTFSVISQIFTRWTYDAFIRKLNMIIIKRSEKYYHEHNNVTRARDEIKKLAHHSLFIPNIFVTLVMDCETEFAASMIWILCKERTDWLVEPALFQSSSPSISAMLVSMMFYGEPK